MSWDSESYARAVIDRRKRWVVTWEGERARTKQVSRGERREEEGKAEELDYRKWLRGPKRIPRTSPHIGRRRIEHRKSHEEEEVTKSKTDQKGYFEPVKHAPYLRYPSTYAKLGSTLKAGPNPSMGRATSRSGNERVELSPYSTFLIVMIRKYAAKRMEAHCVGSPLESAGVSMSLSYVPRSAKYP